MAKPIGFRWDSSEFFTFFQRFLEDFQKAFPAEWHPVKVRLTATLQVGRNPERIVGFMQFRCKERSVPAGRERQNIARQSGETALVLAAKSGDGQAFEILIKRYQGRILAVAKRFTHIREDAEDIVQQSLQKAFVHLHKFEAKSSFSTWLTRIAINEALMLLRRGRGLREISIDDSSRNEETTLRLEISDSRTGPESAFLRSERNQILYEAMDKLKPGIRTAIELRDLSELSIKEAARVMGLSVEALKGRVFNGRRKLHQVLKRESLSISGKQILQASRKANGLSRHQLVCSFGD